jgi:hypothetical protein
VILALGVAGCGDSPAHRHYADPGNFGVYVQAGSVTYQMEISRELNGYSTEDAQYLEGLPKGTTAPSPDQEWYAVFVWAWNQTHHYQTTAPLSAFDIVDTQGNTYYPEKINPQMNPYQWTSQTLAPRGTEPAPDTTASFGPTQGQVLVFKINTTAYANRPLELQIRGGTLHKVEATISLDQ